MDSHDQIAAALDALSWQIELGADEAIGDLPIDRLAVEAQVPKPVASPESDKADVPVYTPPPSQEIAKAATSLPALKAAIEAFDGCALKLGARHTVFADGNPGARVMIVGEAPGRDEDLEGRPFVGASGQLLDKMLAAIGLSRTADNPQEAVYITNVLPWRPPQNRDPSTDEVTLMTPFLHRHIELAAPDVLITMGNAATKTLLETGTGITRLRGKWAAFGDVPVMPMFHPAALLRNPLQKRDTWADLLEIKAKLLAS